MQTDSRNDKIIMYGTPSCPMVPPMKLLLNRSNVDYEYIDIHQDSIAREHVREINNGYESVPTFIFPDGSTLTEPQATEMKRKLNDMGYEVPWSAMIAGYAPLIFVAAFVLFALFRGFGIL